MSVHDEVVRILKELVPEKCCSVDLDEHVRLSGDLGLNSMDILRLLSELEKRYDIDIFAPGVSSKGHETIGALAQLVLDRTK